MSIDRLRDELLEEPWTFGFFQAVTLLEMLSPERAPVGRWAGPSDEVVHFSPTPSPAFPPSEVHSLVLHEDEPARMEVTFMGLVGSAGVLPLEYSMLVDRLWRTGRTALRDFLDIFQHRLLSLFYRAWRRNRFGLDAAEDRLRDHGLDLVGAGSEHMRAGPEIDSRTLAFYSGLLALGRRGASALEAVIADFFGASVAVEQFVGSWHRLPQGTNLVLGEELETTRLGEGAVLGDEVWDPQSKVRIRIGPLDRRAFQSFLPGGNAHDSLQALVRFFGRGEVDFEAQLVLRPDEVRSVTLGEDDQRLGYGSWVCAGSFDRDGDDTIVRL